MARVSALASRRRFGRAGFELPQRGCRYHRIHHCRSGERFSIRTSSRRRSSASILIPVEIAISRLTQDRL
jgi:hypothetical protein